MQSLNRKHIRSPDQVSAHAIGYGQVGVQQDRLIMEQPCAQKSRLFGVEIIATYLVNYDGKNDFLFRLGHARPIGAELRQQVDCFFETPGMKARPSGLLARFDFF